MSEIMEHKNVFEAKLAVMREVPYVQKSTVRGLGYTIASEASFIALLHPSLMKHGLTIAPVKTECLEHSNYVAKDGKPWHRVVVRIVYRLMHAASNSHEDIEVLGEAADAGDKSVAKAMTIAMKYAVRQAFYVETGDDPDRYPSEAQEEESEQEKGKRVLRESFESRLREAPSRKHVLALGEEIKTAVANALIDDVALLRRTMQAALDRFPLVSKKRAQEIDDYRRQELLLSDEAFQRHLSAYEVAKLEQLTEQQAELLFAELCSLEANPHERTDANGHAPFIVEAAR